MNLYFIGAIVAAVALIVVVYMSGSEDGIKTTIKYYEQEKQNAMWQQYFNQGGDDEE